MDKSFLARFCAVLPLALAACHYDPFAHTYTRQQPQLADLPGEYWLAQQTLDPSLDRVLRTEATGPCGHCSLTLEGDGTFTALDFPAWSEPHAGHYELEGFDTFTGRWYLQTVGSAGDGEAAAPVWGLRFDADGRQTAWANLAGESAPYTIHFGFGDPDAGTAMRYQSNASSGQTGEPDFTVVSAFFLLLFAAAAIVVAVIAIVILGCALLALGALAAVVCGAAVLAAAVLAAIVCGVVLIGCALLALAALAAAATLAGGCLLVFVPIAAALVFALRRPRAPRPPSAGAAGPKKRPS